MLKNYYLLIVGVIIFLVVLTGIFAGWFPGFTLSSSSTTTTPTPTGSTATLNLPGIAYCPATGTSWPISNPPTGCYMTSQTLTVKPINAVSGASLSTSYACRFWNTAPAAGGAPQAQDSIQIASNACTGTATYPPGTPISIQICKETSPCDSSAYASTKTAVFIPIPGTGLGGIGGGTVPFTTSYSTGTPPLQIILPIVPSPESATAYTFTWGVSSLNVTTFTASGNVYKTTGSNAIGSNPTFSYKLASTLASGTCTTNPYICGYTTFTDVSLQSAAAPRGSFIAALQREIKSTAGNDYLLTAGSNGLSYATLVTKQTDTVYAAGLSDLSVTKQTDQNGAIVSFGTQSWSETFNLAQLSGSDTATMTYNLYFYYSTTYTTAFGMANTEASAQMTAVVITVKV